MRRQAGSADRAAVVAQRLQQLQKTGCAAHGRDAVLASGKVIKRAEMAWVCHRPAFAVHQAQPWRGFNLPDAGDWGLAGLRRRLHGATRRHRCGKRQLVVIAARKHAVQLLFKRKKAFCAGGVGIGSY